MMAPSNNTFFIFHLTSDAVRDASILFVLSFVGIVFNFLSAVVLIRNRTFRNSFGRLTSLHAVANVGVLLIFNLWATPLIIIEFPANLQWINRRVGQLSLFFAETAYHSCLFISLNRFLAIAAPLMYRKYFSEKVAGIIIIVVCLYSGGYSLTYIVDECDFFFVSANRQWDFTDSECGRFLARYVDLIYNCSLFGLVAIFDLLTLLFLRNANKRLSSLTDDNKKRTRREIRFFFQALTNTGVYFVVLVFFHLVAKLVDAPFGKFASTTIAWCFSHACGGIILVAFNREINRVFLTPANFFKHLGNSRSASSTNKKTNIHVIAPAGLKIGTSHA